MKKKTTTATAIGIATAVATAGAAVMLLNNSPKPKRNAARKKAQKTIQGTMSAIGGAVDAIASTMGK